MGEGECSTSGRITYRQYRDEHDLPIIMDLIDNELSEPYSIFTYRYFLRAWPQLCYIAYDGDRPFGTVVCKQDVHGDHTRGYLGMLVVDKAYRGLGIGSELAKLAIQQMVLNGCEEVVLEAVVSNTGALKLYEKLGFIRDKRLHRYYLDGSDAYRLKLLLPLPEDAAAVKQDASINHADLAQPAQIQPAGAPNIQA